MDKRKCLLDQLTEKIQGFKADSERHRNLYRGLRYSVFFLTSLSALLAGLSLKFPESSPMISVLILLVSAAVGVLTSIEGLRKPSELWIHERTSYYALMDLKREVEFVVDDKASKEVVEQYFFRMQEILGASNEKWNRNIVGVQQTKGAQPFVPGDGLQATLAGSPLAQPPGRLSSSHDV
ncbi:MAG: DUF4231 domain-containing protein [Rhodocyclales bacterium]|nr:DUF4231 domain-containing protein [Rhodocyclales bacterium]